ncbi:MAG: LPS export ABC transporter periplasmic protein LptC [Candidatus Bruticola sp.]
MISPSGRLVCLLALLSVLYGCGENVAKKGGAELPADGQAPAPTASQKSEIKDGDTDDAATSSPNTVSKDKILKDGAAEAPEEAKVREDRQGVNTMSISAKGESPWSLEASRIVYDDSTKKARASSITWNLLDKDGKSSLELKGDAAVVNLETQGLAFEGPVHAVGPKGENIICTKLIWDSQTRKLRGSHGVKVIREGSVMTGDNMVASPDLKQIEVEGNVRIHFNSNSELN